MESDLEFRMRIRERLNRLQGECSLAWRMAGAFFVLAVAGWLRVLAG